MTVDSRAGRLALLAPLLCLPLACGEARSQPIAGEGPSLPSSTGGADGGPNGSSDPGSTSGSTGAGNPGGSRDAGVTPPPVTRVDAGVTSGEAGAPASRKRGIAYGNNSNADLTALSAGIGWWYNWSPSPESSVSLDYASLGVEFVPMIWGGTFNTTKLATQVPQGAKYLLTFNEPNFGAQSNLTPQQAAALWPQIEAFASSRGLQIVSPALNYCGGSCNETNPFTWLDDFFAACTGCKVDYVGAHWYACSKSALQGYLSEYETKYDKPIWLTEFSCLDGSLAATVANEEAYMADALALLEADPLVFRYSWFTGRDTGTTSIDLLGSGSGTLTTLGSDYLAFPQGQ